MINKPSPTLEDVLESLKDNILLSYNWHRIGVVDSFNPQSQTATIILVDQKVIPKSNGSLSYLSYPPLINVPVVINMGKSGGITIPINKGDFCLVSFNDRDIDNWFTNGTTNQPPKSPRTRSLSDGIANVGIFPQTAPIQNYNNLATEIRFLQTLISVQNNKINLQNSIGTLLSVDDLKILIKAKGKITISNDTRNLLTILTLLINQIKLLTTSAGGFLNPSILDQVLTQLNELLE